MPAGSDGYAHPAVDIAMSVDGVSGVQYGISDLPDSLLLNVFSSLGYSSLCLGARLVCRRWHKVSQDAELWRHVDIADHFTNVRFLMLLRQVAEHVEVLECSNCDHLSEQGFVEMAMQTQYPRLRHIAMPIMGKFTDNVFRELSKCCPVLEEIENLSAAFSQDCHPLQSQALFPSLTVLHDRPVSNHGRIRTFSANDLETKQKLWRKELQKVAARCPNITMYRCRRGMGYIDNDNAKEVSGLFPNLKALEIRYGSLGDKGLKVSVSHLNDFLDKQRGVLTEVILDHPGTITDVGLQTLADRCPALETVKISHCSDEATHKGIIYLVNKCKALTDITINNPISRKAETEEGSTRVSRTDAGDECLQAIAESCPDLRTFRLFYSDAVTYLGINALTQCRHLQLLMLYDCPNINDECLKIMREFAHLNALVLVNCNGITPKGLLDFILRAPCLLRLVMFAKNDNFHVDMSGLAEDVLQQIDDNKSFRPNVLHNVTLRNVSGAFVQLLTVLCPALHSLDLRDADRIGSASIASIIRQTETLTLLDLTSVRHLDDSVLTAIAESASNLQKLALGATVANLSNKAIANVIEKCPALTSVSLEKGHSNVSETMLILVAKVFHGDACFLHIDPDCQNNSESMFFPIELHFTPSKYLASTTLLHNVDQATLANKASLYRQYADI